MSYQRLFTVIFTSVSLWALLPFSPFAQFSISGRILNQADGKAVDGASVFINNTTKGANTAPDGRFALGGLTPGKYKLVVSMIGFEPATREVTIAEQSINIGDIIIKPVSIGLSEVKITAKKWLRSSRPAQARGARRR